MHLHWVPRSVSLVDPIALTATGIRCQSWNMLKLRLAAVGFAQVWFLQRWKYWRLSIAFKWWSETVTVSFSVLFDSFHLMHGTSMPFQYHRIPDQQELWARTDQWRWAKTKTWVGTLCRLRLRSCRRPQKETSFNRCPLTIVALCSN